MTDIFISYSHKDEAWKDALKQQLQVLQLRAEFSIWDDRQIEVGANWLPAIESAIAQAKVAILLVSSDFLASEFVTRQEIPKFLQRREQAGLHIVPVIVRPCAWKTVPWLSNLQGATKDNKPLSQYSLGSYELEQAFSEIAEKVHCLLQGGKHAPPVQVQTHEEKQTPRPAQTFIDLVLLKPPSSGRHSKWLIIIIGALGVAGAVWWGTQAQNEPFKITVPAAPSSHKLPPEPIPVPVETTKPETPVDQPVNPTISVQTVDAQPAEPQRLTFEPEMIRITEGSFTMGAALEERKETYLKGYEGNLRNGTRNIVEVNSFQLGKYEVTVGQFKVFVGEENYITEAEVKNACAFWENGEAGNFKSTSKLNWKNPGFQQTDQDPVVCVSIKDAEAYTAWLAKRTGRNYRLPTEAEWEYAARAGIETIRYWDDDLHLKEACVYANVRDLSQNNYYKVHDKAGVRFACDDQYPNTAPVGQFKPNKYNFFDILGNVAEWTSTQEQGKENAYVFKGGSWGVTPKAISAAYHRSFAPPVSGVAIGFRVALSEP